MMSMLSPQRFNRRFWNIAAAVTGYGRLDPLQPPLDDDPIFWALNFPRTTEVWESWRMNAELKRRALATLAGAMVSGRDGGLESVRDAGWKLRELVMASAVVLTPYRACPVIDPDAKELALVRSELLISGRWTAYFQVDFRAWSWTVVREYTVY